MRTRCPGSPAPGSDPLLHCHAAGVFDAQQGPGRHGVRPSTTAGPEQMWLGRRHLGACGSCADFEQHGSDLRSTRPRRSTSAPGLGSPVWPHLHRDCARPRPHLHRDCAHPCHICTGNALTPATSASELGTPRPHLHRDWARSRSHLHRDCARPTSAPVRAAIDHVAQQATSVRTSRCAIKCGRESAA